MDFIEKLFGFAPDGGSGMFEALLFAIPVLGIAWLWYHRRKARSDGSERRDN